MASLDKLREDLDYLTTTITERVRVIDGGIIAVWWGSLIGKDAITGILPHSLLAPTCIAAVSLLFDFLQYVFPYISSRGLLYKLEREHATQFQYDINNPVYKLRAFFFHSKYILMVVALIWLIVALAKVAVA
jgi:hypothetical protein